MQTERLLRRAYVEQKLQQRHKSHSSLVTKGNSCHPLTGKPTLAEPECESTTKDITLSTTGISKDSLTSKFDAMFLLTVAPLSKR